MSKKAGDMTVGTPWKLILQFAVPMIVGNVIQQIYSMVDSIVVGRFVGKEALAAIGATQGVTFLMICLIIGLTMGTGIVSSQYYGAKNEEKIHACVGASLWISIGASIFIGLLSALIAGPVLSFLGTPDEIFNDAKIYMIISMAGSVGPVFYNSCAALMRSLGDSSSQVYGLVISSVLNIILDLIFVIAFGWGVVGVGVATVISQIVSFLVCLVLMYKKHPELHLRKENIRPDGHIVWRIISVGIPMSLQNCVTSIGMMAVQSVINSYGTDTIAGYTAANKIDQIALMPINSIGMAFSTYVGQNYGAKKMQRIRQGLKSGVVVSLVVSVIVGLFILITASPLTALFGFPKGTSVNSVACEYLRIVAVTYWIAGLMYIFLNLFRGMGRMTLPTIAACLEPLSKIAGAIILGQIIGRIGIWISWPIGWTLAFFVPFIVYIATRKKLFNFNGGLHSETQDNQTL